MTHSKPEIGSIESKSRQNSSDLSKSTSRPNSFVSLPNENSIQGTQGRSIGSSRNSWADLPTRYESYHMSNAI